MRMNRIARKQRHWLASGPGALLAAALVALVLLGGAGCFSEENDAAPAFSLAGADGRQVVLAQLLQEHEAVVMVFYRGFF